MPKIPAPCRTSTPPSSPHSAMEYPSSTANCPSMAAELHELLSWVMLDTSSPASGGTPPRRTTSVALGDTLTSRVEDPLGSKGPVLAAPKPVATYQLVSPQADMLEDTVPSSHSSPTTLAPETSKVASVPTILASKTSTRDDTGALPDEVLHLQGEMNTAMGQLFMTRASMDACHRKWVSDTEAAFHENKAQTTEAIWEAKAWCMAMV